MVEKNDGGCDKCGLPIDPKDHYDYDGYVFCNECVLGSMVIKK